ncbi:hypothetical protein [Phyllobacterium sp. YR531]|nr:hypothetical protein [Phyllobacterium sp. YR531]EJM98892.1 hypothetical protein PMI41_04654 [Phyllobacterium sp. YR531]
MKTYSRSGLSRSATAPDFLLQAATFLVLAALLAAAVGLRVHLL